MGTLYLVSTPIGNLEDISVRAIKTLFSVDYIACEDTRRTGLLIEQLRKKYNIIIQTIRQKEHQLISFYDQKERQKIPILVDYLQQDKDVALISDAGTPLVADPGFLLVREALKRHIRLLSIPGASAFLTALISSGLPTDQFLFLGYPPEKQHKRLILFSDLKDRIKTENIHPTIIFYCAPHKLLTTLGDLKNVTGNINITIARELTKIYEEIWYGTISESINTFAEPKGEFVLLFSV